MKNTLEFPLYKEADPWEKERREFWASDLHRDKYKPMIHFLYKHPNRVYKSKQLEEMFGMTYRQVQHCVRFAAMIGHPLCSSGHGYWITTDFDEHWNNNDALESRGWEIVKRAKRAKRFSRLKYKHQPSLFSKFNLRRVAVNG